MHCGFFKDLRLTELPFAFGALFFWSASFVELVGVGSNGIDAEGSRGAADSVGTGEAVGEG